MNLSSALLRYSKHGGYNYRKAYQSLKSTVSKRKVLFGSTILFGAVAPSLLSESFSPYALEPHSGNTNAKDAFYEKFGSTLKWHKDQPLLYGMIGINLCVYAAWKFAPQFMQRHFLCNLANIQSKRYYVLMTSNWSHMDFWHVGLNMYVLYNFGSIVIKTVGIPAFAGIYVGAGLLGSMASISWHVLTKMPHYSSLGASASLLGIIVTFAMYEPNARFKVILSPDSLSFNALNGIIGLVIFDTCGLLLRWKFLDHAAHLTGAAFGFLSWNIVKRIYGTSDDGQLCINGQYMFEGKYKDFKINDKYGKIYSPTKTYFGEMLINNQFSFDGKGCLRNELNGSVFYGYFNNGYIDGIGLLCLSNGKIFPAEYDRKNKDFKIPNNFDPTQLKGLLNKDINVIPFIQQNPNHKEIKESKEESKESQDIQNPNDTSSSSPSSSTNPVTTQPKQQPLPS